MRIEREPIEFDETDLIKETIKDLAVRKLLLSELISDRVPYVDGLEELKDYEINDVTDLLAKEVGAMLYEFANRITKEEVEKHIFDRYNKNK